jgi:hypothetical protein
MNKNLEELKKIEDKIFKTDVKKLDEKALTYMVERIIHCTILILEGFDKRLKRIEAELGIYNEEEVKKLKAGGTDPD